MYCTTGLRKYAFCYFRCFKQPGRGPVMLTVPLSSEVYCQLYLHIIILVAMGGCPQTCMIKLRAASRVPRSHSAPHIRITGLFAHSSQKSLHAHVWALANVRKTGYASISVFAAACSLFNHTPFGHNPQRSTANSGLCAPGMIS